MPSGLRTICFDRKRVETAELFQTPDAERAKGARRPSRCSMPRLSGSGFGASKRSRHRSFRSYRLPNDPTSKTLRGFNPKCGLVRTKTEEPMQGLGGNAILRRSCATPPRTRSSAGCGCGERGFRQLPIPDVGRARTRTDRRPSANDQASRIGDTENHQAIEATPGRRGMPLRLGTTYASPRGWTDRRDRLEDWMRAVVGGSAPLYSYQQHPHGQPFS